MMSPGNNRKLIDVACGTGDIGKLFLDTTNKEAEITPINKARRKGKPDSVISPSLPAACGIRSNVTYAPTPINEACPKFNKPVNPK